MTSSLTLVGPSRSHPISMPHWFPQTFVENLLQERGIFQSKVSLNEGDILIPHDVKKRKNFREEFFSGIKALKAFNQIAKSDNDCLRCYKGVIDISVEC